MAVKTTKLLILMLAIASGGRAQVIVQPVPGVDAAQQIATCIAALPSTGGTCDARALQGAQTLSTDPFAGVTKPGTLMLGHATITQAVAINIPSNWTLILDGTTIDQSAQILIPPSSSNVRIACTGAGGLFNNLQTGYVGSYGNFSSIQVGSYTSGYGATASTSLSSDAKAGATTLSVGSSNGFVAGQDVLLKENYPGPYRYAEWNLVASTGAGTITLKYPLEHTYRSKIPSTGVHGFMAGALAKIWRIEGCRFTSSTTTPSASGSAGGIFVATAVDGEILNNVIQYVGGRGIIAGASGYPSGRILIKGNKIRGAGMVPARGGSPALEVYSQSSHVIVSDNQVWDSNSVGIDIHGFHQTVESNQVWFTSNAGACYSSDTAESIIYNSNLASGCAGPGFLAFGAAIENTTEAQRLTYTGNIAQDTAGDGFSMGTWGSPTFVRAILIGNRCYRARGTNGCFVVWSNTPQFGIQLEGNWAEGANGTTGAGYMFGNPRSGASLVGNHSQSNVTGYFLNSMSSARIIGNASDGDTTGFAFGGTDYSNIVANTCTNPGSGGCYSGSAGGNSSVFGNTGLKNQGQ